MSVLAFPPSLASPSFTFDDPVRTTQHLLDRVYSLIPLAFRPAHIAPLAPPPIIQGCFRNYIHSKLLTIEREGFPIYYGHTQVTSHAVAAQSVLAVFPPTSSLPRTLHKFQSLVSRPPNCYIQFKLCACGSVHGHLTSLTDLDAGTPLYIGDPPVDHLDFIIQFDGGAFREHRVGGASVVLWKHTTQGLTLLDTFAVPLSSLVLTPPMLKQSVRPMPCSWPHGTFHSTALRVSLLKAITALSLTS